MTSTETLIKKLNGIKGQDSLNYFGTYKSVEWIIEGERDGNKVWWYLTEDGVYNDFPAPNLKNALESMIENIEYEAKRKKLLSV